VTGDRGLIDRIRYDIEARWQDQNASSERNIYRELLKRILRTNSNLQLYVKGQCDRECDRPEAGI
jgi:hypothetical protein